MWIEPKVNWTKADYFNAVDFNRIKNNLIYLKDISNKLYSLVEIHEVCPDKTYRDYFYADEINKMIDNFQQINTSTVNITHSPLVKYHDNGSTMTYSELNKLESSILELYNKLTNQFKGRRNFAFNFGRRREI